MIQDHTAKSPFSFDLNINQNKKRLASYSSKLNSQKTENREIMTEITGIRTELYKITEPAFHIGEVIKRMGEESYLVKISTEGRYIVKVKQTLVNLIKENKVKLPKVKRTLKVLENKDKEKKQHEKSFKEGGIAPGTRVALNNDSYMIERILPTKVDPLISLMKVEKVPDASYDLIGGLDEQIKKVSEVIELPIKRPELFEALGIVQPKGVLLYGPPGTGKTLVARAVAHHTDCTFIKVSGGELVQKYIGEGTRLVRELFIMAREHAPSIIFMDEIDSIGTKRISGGKGSSDSEVQRTMLELLNQLDGFESSKNIKVIMATNRIDILDPALLRPGRIDRKIEFPKPKNEARFPIFKIHTRKMNLGENVDLEQVAENAEGASGADIKSICTEAGMFALREKRGSIEKDDFDLATNKVLSKNDLLISGENDVWV